MKEPSWNQFVFWWPKHIALERQKHVDEDQSIFRRTASSGHKEKIVGYKSENPITQFAGMEYGITDETIFIRIKDNDSYLWRVTCCIKNLYPIVVLSIPFYTLSFFKYV